MHWHAGRRIGELCSSLAIDPKTVRKYIAPAIEAGHRPRRPAAQHRAVDGPRRGLVPGAGGPVASARRRGRRSSRTDERIKDWLGEVTVSTIHQRLRDDHGLTASESSLRRYIWANFDEEVARAAVRVLRDTPPAGEEAQVDYGLLGRWFDPGHRAAAPGVGLHHGAVLLAAAVPAPGAQDGRGLLGGEPRARLRVLRRCRGPGGARQPEDRGDQARSL